MTETTTRAPTSTVPPTTVGVCDENMDEYGQVDVTRTDEAGSPINKGDGWTPNNPSTDSEPYSGSHINVNFDEPVKITSILVETSDGSDETVKIAVRVKVEGSDIFIQISNRADDKNVFNTDPGSKIPIPDGIGPVVEIEVYVVDPKPDSPIKVTPYGCPAGKLTFKYDGNSGDLHIFA